MKTLIVAFSLALMAPAFFMIAQDAKAPDVKVPDMKPLEKSDAIEFENYGLKIDLLTAQREKLRMSLCEKYSLGTTCLVGQKQDGQWVAVMPQLTPPNSKDGGSPGNAGPTGSKQDIKK